MTLKRIILIVMLIFSFGIAGYQFWIAYRMQDPQFQRTRTLGDLRMIEPSAPSDLVDLDELALLRPRKEGTREFPLEPRPIAFDAAVKQEPKSISTSYLQEVFEVMGLTPPPAVSHRMFVETDQGLIMPVYVWDEVIGFFPADSQARRMQGYHVYTYAKGPAIVVDG